MDPIWRAYFSNGLVKNHQLEKCITPLKINGWNIIPWRWMVQIMNSSLFMGYLYFFHVNLEVACSFTKRRMGFDVIDEICMYMNEKKNIRILDIKKKPGFHQLTCFFLMVTGCHFSSNFQQAGVVFNPVTVEHLVGRLLKIFSNVNVRVDSESKDRNLRFRNVSVVFVLVNLQIWSLDSESP